MLVDILNKWILKLFFEKSKVLFVEVINWRINFSLLKLITSSTVLQNSAWFSLLGKQMIDSLGFFNTNPSFNTLAPSTTNPPQFLYCGMYRGLLMCCVTETSFWTNAKSEVNAFCHTYSKARKWCEWFIAFTFRIWLNGHQKLRNTYFL